MYILYVIWTIVVLRVWLEINRYTSVGTIHTYDVSIKIEPSFDLRTTI